MILFPAVDIQAGKAVRLRQGKKDQSTVFATDPVAMAEHWRNEGASWLHVVDLDGAFEGRRANASIIGEMVMKAGIPAQVGGGIRTLDDAQAYIDAGVTRLIIGTTALENMAAFGQMCARFPGRIGVALDGRDDHLMSRGWVTDSGCKISELLPRLRDAGAAFIIYTDISRDGMQSGLNLPAIENILKATDLPVIAAGGVSTLADIAALAQLPQPNLEGAISGRALYEKTLSLQEALAFLARRELATGPFL